MNEKERHSPPENLKTLCVALMQAERDHAAAERTLEADAARSSGLSGSRSPGGGVRVAPNSPMAKAAAMLGQDSAGIGQSLGGYADGLAARLDDIIRRDREDLAAAETALASARERLSQFVAHHPFRALLRPYYHARFRLSRTR